MNLRARNDILIYQNEKKFISGIVLRLIRCFWHCYYIITENGDREQAEDKEQDLAEQKQQSEKELVHGTV